MNDCEHPSRLSLADSNFATALVNIRKRHRLLQKQVAYGANIDPSYLAAIECGRRAPPTTDTLTRLVRALNATPAEVQEIRRLAAVGRISRAIRGNADSLPNAGLLELLVGSVPYLDVSAANAICSILAALTSNAKRQEINM